EVDDIKVNETNSNIEEQNVVQPLVNGDGHDEIKATEENVNETIDLTDTSKPIMEPMDDLKSLESINENKIVPVPIVENNVDGEHTDTSNASTPNNFKVPVHANSFYNDINEVLND